MLCQQFVSTAAVSPASFLPWRLMKKRTGEGGRIGSQMRLKKKSPSEIRITAIPPTKKLLVNNQLVFNHVTSILCSSTPFDLNLLVAEKVKATSCAHMTSES